MRQHAILQVCEVTRTVGCIQQGWCLFSEAKATGGLETEEVGELDARTLRARETVEKGL